MNGKLCQFVVLIFTLIMLFGITFSFAQKPPIPIETRINPEKQTLEGDFIGGPEVGCVKWSFSTASAINQSVAIGFNNNLHIPTEDGILYTLSPDGDALWTYDALSEITSPPTIGTDGTIYIGTQEGAFYAIDPNGTLSWPETLEGMIYAAPTVDAAGRVFAATAEGYLYAFAGDGTPLWSFTTGNIGSFKDPIFASPAVGYDAAVYVIGLYDPTLYALNPVDGTEKWTTPLPSSNGSFASPVVAQDGTIYLIPLYDSILYAIDPDTGSILWDLDIINGTALDQQDIALDYPQSKCVTEPVIGTDGTIYTSINDPYLRAIDPNGSLKWMTRLGMVGGFTMTATGNNLIYAACDDGTLYVVNSEGDEVSRFTGSGFLSFPLVGTDGTIYISDTDNTFRALSAGPCDPNQVDLHRPEDISEDGIVNLKDFSLLASDWLNYTGFPFEPRCNIYREGRCYLIGDIDHNLYIELGDLTRIATRWLSVD